MDKSLLTDWIWTPKWTVEDDASARIVLFRRELDKGELLEHLPLRISADSRYKLYVNGNFIQEGPQKGDRTDWYLDRADLAPFLTTGKNALAVEVLRYPEAMPRRNHSLYRSTYPCLYVEGLAKDGWRCWIASHIRFRKEPFIPAPIHAAEDASGAAQLSGWKLTAYDDSAWAQARPYHIQEIMRADSPFHLVERTIPPQRHSERRFKEVACVREPADTAHLAGAWNALLRNDLPVVIPAAQRQIVELDAGELECGYLQFAFAGGAGSHITVIPSECYAYPQPPRETPMGPVPQPPLKGDRTDSANGQLFGPEDHYCTGGFGTAELPETYEPFWFRTFRFLRIEIETATEPLEIRRLRYRETGYPLDSKVSFETSDESFNHIWDISLRTLRRCMHETYIDCPFYEQLQYAMDARSEILYTYHVAADDRLARQCMDAFRKSQRPDGMTNSCAPTVETNVIPGFSIFYLLMVHDHMMYFGDQDLVKEHIPAIMRILDFFDRNLTGKGLVGRIGGPILRTKYWSFIDWAAKWNETGGVPTACMQGDGSITMESLLYLLGLQKAAELADYIGLHDLRCEYDRRAKTLSDSILCECVGNYTDERGTVTLLQDGPGIAEYSAHCQVFAILTGLVDADKGKAMLAAVLERKDRFPQCSVAMQFYLFRALEKTGWYEKADELWELWRKMLRNHMTTCVENDTDERSDCHAWASTILYELPATYLGVRPTAPGFEKMIIHPIMGHLSHAKGCVPTPKGEVYVEWYKMPDGGCEIHYKVPGAVEVTK